MQDRMKIVGLGGSLGGMSTSLAALRVALRGAEEEGAEVQLFDIRAMDLPVYTPDYSTPPPNAVALADAVFDAHGMLWSSPLYHGTISGTFKNAIDWLDLLRNREPAFLTDKIIGLISTAGGVQGLQAVNTMEFCVRAMRAWAVPMVMPIPRAWEAFDETGQPRDPRVENQLKALGKEVVRAALQFSREGTCDYVMPEVK